MRTFILLMLISSVTLSVFPEESKTSAPLNVAPKILSVIGTSDAEYPSTRWPNFYKSSSDNPTCAAKLRDETSLTRKSGYNGTQYKTILSKTVNFENEGLGQYRKSAKFLISWTVRVEGRSVIVNPWKAGLCHPWHGTSYQSFPGGDVFSRLYINGSVKKPSSAGDFSSIARMTLPAGRAGDNVNPSDPTHTGSAVISPEDFGGEFPNVMKIEVRWYNDTCMEITTPKNMRNLVVTIIPM